MTAEDEAFAETMPFSALLTNAAMHPEASQASRATQRYAVAVSKEWILMGHRDLVARDRSAVPAEIDLAIGSWSGKSQDGVNEEELVTSLESDYQRQLDQAIQAVGLGAPFIFAIIGALFGVVALLQGSWLFGLLLLAVAGGLFYMAKKNQETARDKARQQIGAEGRARYASFGPASRSSRICAAPGRARMRRPILSPTSLNRSIPTSTSSAVRRRREPF